MSEIPLYAFIVISDDTLSYKAETLDEGLPAKIKEKAIAVSEFTMSPPEKEGFAYKREKKEKKSEFKEFREKFYAKEMEQQERELAAHKPPKKGKRNREDDAEAEAEVSLLSDEADHQKELWDMLIENKKETKNMEGTLSFTKDVDALTPFLHGLCVNHNQKKEKIEPIKEIAAYFFHLENGKTELTSAYILQNCKITKLSVSSDEDDLPSETIEASFQKMFIYLKVLLPPNESKGSNNRWGWRGTRWDFIKGEEPKNDPEDALKMMDNIK